MCVSFAIFLKASALRAGGGTPPSRTHPLPVPPLPKFLDPPLVMWLSLLVQPIRTAGLQYRCSLLAVNLIACVDAERRNCFRRSTGQQLVKLKLFIQTDDKDQNYN